MLEAGTADFAECERVCIALQTLGDAVVSGAVVGEVALFPVTDARQLHQLSIVIVQRISCDTLTVVRSKYPITLLGVFAETS